MGKQPASCFWIINFQQSVIQHIQFNIRTHLIKTNSAMLLQQSFLYAPPDATSPQVHLNQCFMTNE